MNSGKRLLPKCLRLRVTLFFLAASINLNAAVPPINWEHAYPYPTGSWLRVAAWGPPGFVTAGFDGEMLFSADGIQWESTNTKGIGAFWFLGVCHYNGRYVAVSDNLIVTSTNGRDWAVATQNTHGFLRACAGGDGKFAAVGSDQSLLTSTNGIDWQQGTGPASLFDIAFGNGVWIALTGGSLVYVSSDLMNWTNVQTGYMGKPVLTSICFGQGRFVAGGSQPFSENSGYTVIKTSTNGVHWDLVSLDGLDAWGETQDLAFGGGIFVAAHGDFFLRSTNGLSWERIDAPGAGGSLRGVAASTAGRFVAVGDYGAMLSSEGARSWQVISTEPRFEIYAVACNSNKLVAAGGFESYIGGPIGSSAIVSSTNGSDWHVAITNLFDKLTAVAYGNGLWVVTGDHGAVFTSSNAVDWIDRSLSAPYPDLRTLAYGNGRFVAVGNLIYYSTNGVNWVSSAIPPTGDVARVRFCNGRFIGVGGDNDGIILQSSDGVAWQSAVLTNAGWFGGVAFGKGRYVAAGRDNSAVSFNGTNWTLYPVPASIDDLQYVEGWFIGVAYNGIVTSRDGIIWEKAGYPAIPGYLRALSYDRGYLLATSGLNLYHGLLQDIQSFKQQLGFLEPSQIEFYGAVGFQYRLEYSSNLTSWAASSDWSTGHNDYLWWNINPTNQNNFWRVAGRPQ